jgi:hypothetical protein
MSPFPGDILTLPAGPAGVPVRALRLSDNRILSA